MQIDRDGSERRIRLPTGSEAHPAMSAQFHRSILVPDLAVACVDHVRFNSESRIRRKDCDVR
jgi:hypothetical protein